MFPAVGHVSFTLICFFCFSVILTNSRTSTLWRLSPDNTKIVDANPFTRVVSETGVAEDDVFSIITSTVHRGNSGSWVRKDDGFYCANEKCQGVHVRTVRLGDDLNNHSADGSKGLHKKTHSGNDDIIDCGKPVNFTYYDNLVGIANRNEHPNVPEHQPSLILKSRRFDKVSYDDEIELYERRLRKAKKEKPKSVQLYSQIGNLWRVKGDSMRAIECFRRALAVSPHNSEALLSMARVLFSLQYLDDAIYLTRRSLETQPSDRVAWQHYFTLGEIFKAYGHYQEATLHLQHVLQLKPDFKPASDALQEMQAIPLTTNVHVSTVIIIVSLVVGVCLSMLSLKGDNDGEYEIRSSHNRHQTRTLASSVSSIRGFRISKSNRLFRKLFG